jgi:heptosyltransferase-2
MKTDSILIFAPSWIGDSVMSLGAMRAVRKAHPKARLVALTRPWVQELYAGCDVFDDTILYDPHGADRGISGFLRAARRVRLEGFDVSILFPNAFRAAFLIHVAGIPERWGYATEKRGMFLTRCVPPAPRPFGRHQAHFYLDLIGGLGLDLVEPDLSLQATEPMRRAGGALLEREGYKGGPLVGVHPGATNSRAKVWQASRYAEVASKLAERLDGQVVILGGITEGILAEEVRAGLPKERVLMLQGKTSLGELMGVLSELSVFLTNDSGPMHLAAALGVPTVAVFGPTDYRETGPYSSMARVVREPVECSPCLYRDCPIDHRCMERVTPERVYDEALALVSS